MVIDKCELFIIQLVHNINILPQIKISFRHVGYEACPKEYRILGCVDLSSSETLIPMYEISYRWISVRQSVKTCTTAQGRRTHSFVATILRTSDIKIPSVEQNVD